MMPRDEIMFFRSKCHASRWRLVLVPEGNVYIVCRSCGQEAGQFMIFYKNLERAFDTVSCNCGCGNKTLVCKECSREFDLVLGTDDKMFLQCENCSTTPADTHVVPYGKSVKFIHDVEGCSCCDCEKKRKENL